MGRISEPLASPPPLAYVMPSELREMLLMYGGSDSALPSDSVLESLLRILEYRIDAWLRRRLAPTEYIWERPSNANRIVNLPHYPIIEVKAVYWCLAGVIPAASPQYNSLNNNGNLNGSASIIPAAPYAQMTLPGNISDRPQMIPIAALWEGGTYVGVPTAGDRYRIVYTAGYDPIPYEVKDCIFDLFNNYFARPSNNISPAEFTAFLNTPTKVLTQVSLPGGISQSFRIGNMSSEASGDKISTEFTKAIAPLLELRLRRQIIT